MVNDNLLNFFTYFTTNSREKVIDDFSKFIDEGIDLTDNKETLMKKFLGTVIVDKEEE